MKKQEKSKTRRIVGKIIKWFLVFVLVLALAVAGFFGWLTIREYDPEPQVPAESGSTELANDFSGKRVRIATLNTGYGGLDRSADFFMDGGEGVTPESEELVRANVDGICGILRKLDADFYFLQEVDTNSKRSYGQNQWQKYAECLDGFETRYALNYSCDYVPIPFPETIGKVHSGVATFAACHMTEGTRYALPCPFTWPTRIANLKRCMLVTRVELEDSDKELVLVNFHLEAYDEGDGKEQQTRQLLEFIRAEYNKGNYVIAGGDFNQYFPGTLDAYPMKETSEWRPGDLSALPDGWSYACDASTPTCRLLNQPLDENSDLTQYYVIDGFITSPNLLVESVETVDEHFAYTDHNPVVMEVSLIEN